MPRNFEVSEMVASICCIDNFLLPSMNFVLWENEVVLTVSVSTINFEVMLFDYFYSIYFYKHYVGKT
ncbi:hypothetical protein EB796_016449 [Bugula neritina]|uniref:Uncharacterized protein n=1 Tax=Bugula neritina TaxID=10212 RepID=A0A7J7JG10_BUGNE|nr:hypothetical protein EB796_016449 [Bugula neritina]